MHYGRLGDIPMLSAVTEGYKTDSKDEAREIAGTVGESGLDGSGQSLHRDIVSARNEERRR